MESSAKLPMSLMRMMMVDELDMGRCSHKVRTMQLFFRIFLAMIFGDGQAGVDGFLGEEDWGFAGLPFVDGAG